MVEPCLADYTCANINIYFVYEVYAVCYNNKKKRGVLDCKTLKINFTRYKSLNEFPSEF